MPSAIVVQSRDRIEIIITISMGKYGFNSKTITPSRTPIPAGTKIASKPIIPAKLKTPIENN